MKIKLSYLLPALALLILGCTKTNENQQPVPLPTGIFSGQFLRVHVNPKTAKYDTVKATLTLTLSQATGFQVGGDTTLHAGSFGGYGVNGYLIQFVDQTYSAAKPGTKYHLNGVYNYGYDGSQLDIYNTIADTLSYQYTLKKTN